MGEHDQQPTNEQEPQERASHSDAAEAATDHAERDEREEGPEAPPGSAEDFVDNLSEEDQWKVLNAQKDVALHLHTQTTRFLQLVFTLVGLILTAVAVLGPSTIAGILPVVNINTAISAIGWVNAVAFGAIIVRHVFEFAVNAFMLAGLIGFRLVVGLTIYPAIGDHKTHPAETAEWIRANRDQLDDLNERLSHGYSHLFWLFLHASIAVFLYYGALYSVHFLVHGLVISVAVIVLLTIRRSLPESPNEREEYRAALGNGPIRLFKTLLKEEYEVAVNETDSHIGAWRHFLSHGSHFVWLFVHVVFALLIIA